MHPVYEKLKLVLGLQSISILVPRIWFHVPHPSNGQKMPKTKPFRRQKRRFLDGARLQEFWLRRAGPPYRPQANGGGLNFYTYIGHTNSHFKRIGPIESFSNSLSKFISNSLPNSFSSDSLHKLVPNFLKKCTQFTKSLNWF